MHSCRALLVAEISDRVTRYLWCLACGDDFAGRLPVLNRLADAAAWCDLHACVTEEGTGAADCKQQQESMLLHCYTHRAMTVLY
jgi:hypothetical protein